MRRWALFLGVLAASPAWPQEPKTKVTVTFSPGADRGEAIYKTYCHHCHGDTGDGTGHIGKGLPVKPIDLTAPELADRLTEERIYKLVRDGSNAQGGSIYMISWKSVLREEQLRDVAAYTARLAAEGRARRVKR